MLSVLTNSNWYNKWLPHSGKAALNMSSIVWIGCSTAAASGTSAAAVTSKARSGPPLAGPVELLAGPVEPLAGPVEPTMAPSSTGVIFGGGRGGPSGGSRFTGSVTVKSWYKYLWSKPLPSPSNILTLT